MKGLCNMGTPISGKSKGMASPHKVMSASNLHGQGAKASSTKSNLAGGFMASRKMGSVKGSHK